MKQVRKVKTLPKPPGGGSFQNTLIRVAAYARVSTDKDEQHTSFEGQISYYTKLIDDNPAWTFAGMYSDEGISGLGTVKREGFNSLIEDAVSGKMDMIITKSISRFARNTVDTLETIRKLKENGVRVYFEKEEMWSDDSKGEFMLTLLSCLAQEEARSISESTAWGIRRNFSEGKYSVAYSRFLGYDKGFQINQSEALIVRKIYSMFFQGYSPYSIARELTGLEIPTPGGARKWCASTVKGILTNEKYKGDALLQKCYTVDFLTRKRKTNEGELDQYYITGGHEGIVAPAVYEEAQLLIASRKDGFERYSGVGPLCSKIICADCHNYMGYKQAYREKVWECRKNEARRKKHHSSIVYDRHLKQILGLALLWLYKSKKEIAKSISDIVLSKYGDRPEVIERVRSGKALEIAGYDEVAFILKTVTVYKNDNMNIRFINGSIYRFTTPEHTAHNKSKVVDSEITKRRKELYERKAK